MYMAEEAAWAMYSGTPMAPPASRPRAWAMIAKAPPGRTRTLLAMLARDRAVVPVMAVAVRMISRAPSRPALPTSQPSRR